IIFSLLTVGLFSSSAVQAQSDMDLNEIASESALGRVVVQQIRGETPASQLGPHFRGGDSVIANESYNGDLYIGAGTAQVLGTVEGDLLAAGGSISVDGTVTEDARIAGGNITFNGDVGGNVTVLGGTVTFGPNSTVAGSVVVFGGNITMQGSILGNVYGGAGAASLNGSVGQNVNLDAGSLNVSPSASVSGSLIATVEEQSEISPEAQIAGMSDIKVREKSDKKVNVQQAAGISAAGIFSQFIFGSLMSLAGGLLLLWLLPGWFTQLARTIEVSPGPALGWGLVYIFMMPIVFVFLLLTVIGIPLAFLTLLIWITNAIIASWITALVIGRWLADKNEWSWIEGRYTQLVVGVLVLNAISLIPIIGWLLGFAAFVLGMGALLLWIKSLFFVDTEVVPATRTARKRK
ncbi:MAG: hypothetical protein QG639_44, partial [Patescibacteria group bacterium]|nr:hypothetical protein [Patescibacteria group bacterium]